MYMSVSLQKNKQEKKKEKMNTDIPFYVAICKVLKCSSYEAIKCTISHAAFLCGKILLCSIFEHSS